MSEWQIPAYLMSIATSCGPGSRRSMVVLVNGSVADVAAYAAAVLMTIPLLFGSNQPISWLGVPGNPIAAPDLGRHGPRAPDQLIGALTRRRSSTLPRAATRPSPVCHTS